MGPTGTSVQTTISRSGAGRHDAHFISRLATAASLLLAATAQQQPATLNQRIGAEIGVLVIQNAGLQMQVEQLSSELKAAQDRVRALEDEKKRGPVVVAQQIVIEKDRPKSSLVLQAE